MKINLHKTRIRKVLKSSISKKIIGVFLGLFLLLSGQIFGQGNTPCAATALATNATCIVTNGTTVGATYASDAANGGAPTCASPGAPDVWYSIVAPASGSITLTMSGGGITDGGMALYNGPCGAPTQIACSDDAIGLMPQIVQSGLTPGATYYVRVWSYFSGTGTFGICDVANPAPPPPPANDNPCAATVLTPGVACTYTSGTTSGATQTLAGCVGTADDDVWYSFVAAGTSQVITVAASASFDPVVEIFSGTCGGLTAMSCNDFAYLSGSTGGSTIAGLTIGQTYWVRIYDYFSGVPATTTFNICITTPVVVPPGPGDDCSQAIPFCTGTTYTFPNNTGIASLGSGGTYGCLFSTPNPVWYFMQAATAGNLSIGINQGTTAGAGNLDVDYCLWGPFTSQAAGCAGISAANILSCSYSAAATETANIPNAIVGQFYILLLTNFSNTAGVIQFSQTLGPGSTNCAVLCGMSALTAVPGACVPATNTYSVTGSVTFVYPPATGNLVITSSCGGSVTVPSSGLVSPYNYTISGITPTGGPCTITAGFTADATCTLTQTYTAPAPCTSCVATATNTGPYCAGATIQLNATGGGTYSWSGPGAFTSTLQNPTRPASTVAMSGTYTVTVTNGATTCTAITTVTVNPLPVITAPANIAVCAGTAIAATNFVSVPAGATYTWSNSNVAIGLTATGTGNVPGFTGTNATTAAITGTITVTPTLSGCVGLPITYTITINPQPTSAFTQTANTCLTGNSFTFTSSPAIPVGYTQSWTFGGGGASPASSTTSPVTVTYTTPGTYTITHIVTGPGGCTSTTTSTVTIYPMPIVTVNSITICAGQTAVLTAGGASTYTWSAGATSGGGATATATPLATTTYTVTGTSTDGCTATAIATVTVTPLPLVTVNSPTICFGATATLTAAGGTTYLWSTAAITNPITVTPAGTTTYTVTGTTAGCSNSAVSTVTVTPLTTVTAEANLTYCPGAAVPLNTFTSAPAGATFTWTNSNINIGLVASGTASVPAFTATNATAAAITGTITITPTLLGCVGTPSTYTITVNPSPITTVTSATICPGGTATLTAGGASTYSWSAGVTVTGITTATATPASTTSYTVTGTSAAGCTSTAVATVTVSPVLVITVNSPTICAGVATTLTAGGGTTYTWSAGATSTGANTATASPVTTTSYTVTGTTA
ncbi:MAG: PKD domain-containing protein, partial [Bacteroidetes bacterium]|nr:PKD domain-containing protein [Bacteroidota bacterium]